MGVFGNLERERERHHTCTNKAKQLFEDPLEWVVGPSYYLGLLLSLYSKCDLWKVEFLFFYFLNRKEINDRGVKI